VAALYITIPVILNYSLLSGANPFNLKNSPLLWHQYCRHKKGWKGRRSSTALNANWSQSCRASFAICYHTAYLQTTERAPPLTATRNTSTQSVYPQKDEKLSWPWHLVEYQDCLTVHRLTVIHPSSNHLFDPTGSQTYLQPFDPNSDALTSGLPA